MKFFQLQKRLAEEVFFCDSINLFVLRTLFSLATVLLKKCFSHKKIDISQNVSEICNVDHIFKKTSHLFTVVYQDFMCAASFCFNFRSPSVILFFKMVRHRNIWRKIE